MNRYDFQKLATVRAREAKLLLNKKFYNGAYYLAGYAIECALKACIAKDTKRFEFPPNRKIIEKVYTHDLKELLAAAGLKALFDNELKTNQELEKYWSSVKD